MNIDSSKYQMNIIITDAGSLVKNRALEDASIPDNLGFIIKPSSATATTPTSEKNEEKKPIDNLAE